MNIFSEDGPFRPFERLFSAFEQEGHELLFVGGCVRDRLMHQPQIGDIDLATSATPEQTKHVLTRHRYKAIPLGEKFGTITTRVAGQTVEITTYRVGELYEPGSRHPVVQFGTDIVADLARRDLSINAMAMRANGEIVDPFDGRAAIARRCLEVPGGGYENTISILRDDPLRLLRTARFAARFNYAPTPDTTRAAVESAASLEHISRERWAAELDKLLVAAHPAIGLRWLFEVNAWSVLFPDAKTSDDARDTLVRTIECCPNDRDVRWTALIWVVLTGATGPQRGDAPTAWPSLAVRTREVATQAERFRLSNARRARMQALIALPFDEPTLAAPPTNPQLRRWCTDAQGHVFGQLQLAVALAHGDASARARASAIQAAIEQLLEDENPVPTLPTGLGAELRQALSLKGAEIGEAMAQVREAILDGLLPNEADVDTYVRWAAQQNERAADT